MELFQTLTQHQVYLGADNQINKGEHLTMNSHKMGAQPYSMFSNPESRRHAIHQFELDRMGVESMPDISSKSLESLNHFGDIEDSWKEVPNKDVIDDVEMKKECIDLVRNFYDEGLDLEFAEKGLQGRCEIISSFYNDVKETMGIDADISFASKPPKELGGYNPSTNKIDLNANYLESSDCDDLLNTILHESRHAFQKKCIQHPDSVTVKNNIIDVWADNMEHYISPQDDFEAYENQEIEKDANYFADSVIKKGTDVNYV